MRILVAWDDPGEVETMRLFLAAGDNEVESAESAEEMRARAESEKWDVFLIAMTFPTPDVSLGLFNYFRESCPNVPTVIAYRLGEMLNLPRFLVHGLRFYLVRDPNGDFIFLMQSCLDSALIVSKAEQSRHLADKLQEEMDGVRRLQETIIPKGLKPPPGYRTAARYEPAQMLTSDGNSVMMAGGDYYDLFCPDKDTLVVLIGDASGHGLKACMSIIAMHTLVRMFAGEQYRDTARFVREINQRLSENSIVQTGGGFITLLYAAIDTRTHTMRWTSAGHPPAVLQRLDTNEVVEVGTTKDGGMPLGIMTDIDYDAHECQLPPHCRVLLYTDGLPDAFTDNEAGHHQAFGVPGIRNTLQKNRDCDPEELMAKLFADSSGHTHGTGRHDDTSVVVLERS